MALFDDASLVVTPNGYKAGTLYSIKPTSGAGDMTVVRATTATRVNSAGLIESVAINVPRLDYSNGSCPSLLVEPQRTNLITYSEQFDNASYVKTEMTVTANSAISPDGTQNADKLIPSTNATNHYLTKSIIFSGDGSLSIYAKADGYQYLILLNSSGNVSFDLLNGIATTGGVIVNVGNGWYRCIVNKTWANGTMYISCGSSSSPSFFNGAGNGTSGVLLYGFQLEAGSYPTSYIPTTTAAVTRNADAISKTGISSLIGQTEGTIFVDYVLNGQTNNANILNSEKNTTCSLFMAQKTNGNFDAGLYASAVIKARITAGSIAVNQRAKVAYAYKSGNSALYINGVQVGTSADTYTLPSTLDDIFLNDITTYFSYQENVSYNQATLFPTRLTNAELASLTTL
jgi:hypothetical protein